MSSAMLLLVTVTFFLLLLVIAHSVTRDTSQGGDPPAINERNPPTRLASKDVTIVANGVASEIEPASLYTNRRVIQPRHSSPVANKNDGTVDMLPPPSYASPREKYSGAYIEKRLELIVATSNAAAQIDIGAISDTAFEHLRQMRKAVKNRGTDRDLTKDSRRDLETKAIHRFWQAYRQARDRPILDRELESELHSQARIVLVNLLDANEDDRVLQLGCILSLALYETTRKHLIPVFANVDSRVLANRLIAATRVAAAWHGLNSARSRDTEYLEDYVPPRAGLVVGENKTDRLRGEFVERESAVAWSPVAPALFEPKSRLARIATANGVCYDLNNTTLIKHQSFSAEEHQRDGPYVSHAIVEKHGSSVFLVDGTRLSFVVCSEPPLIVSLRRVPCDVTTITERDEPDNRDRSIEVKCVLRDDHTEVIDAMAYVTNGSPKLLMDPREKAISIHFDEPGRAIVLLRQRHPESYRFDAESTWLNLDTSHMHDGFAVVEGSLRVQVATDGYMLTAISKGINRAT